MHLEFLNLTDMSNRVSAFGSAARTASEDSGILQNASGRGAHVIIDMTVVNVTGSVTFDIEGYDPISQKFYPILTSSAISAVSTTVLKVYPSLTPSANVVAQDVLPPLFRVRATHANAVAMTYSVGVIPLP